MSFKVEKRSLTPKCKEKDIFDVVVIFKHLSKMSLAT